MDLPEAARLLAAVAPAFGIGVRAIDSGALRAAVPVLMADCSTDNYDILVLAVGERASAREAAKMVLPTFCPMRHINADGSFCLNWEVVESLAVIDAATAEVWWGAVLQFLRLQRRAERLRRWPDRREWPHGNAALHQWKARSAAAAISPNLLEGLDRLRLSVRRSRARSAEGSAFRLMINGKPLVRLFVDQGRPATLRQACPCGQDRRPLTLGQCRDHAARFVDLVKALRDVERAEAAFWKSFEGRPCCGTMDGCPLDVAA